MEHPTSFDEVLEAVDRLLPEDQEALVEIVRRRVAARGRERLRAEAEEARREFEQGRCAPTSVDDLMGEILA